MNQRSPWLLAERAMNVASASLSLRRGRRSNQRVSEDAGASRQARPMSRVCPARRADFELSILELCQIRGRGVRSERSAKTAECEVLFVEEVSIAA